MIGFGQLKIYLLLPFLASGLYVFRYYCIVNICSVNQSTKPFLLFTLFIHLGQITNGIFVIISYLLNKSTVKNKKELDCKTQKVIFKYLPSSTTSNQPKKWHLCLCILFTSIIYSNTMNCTYMLEFKMFSAIQQEIADLILELRLFNLFFIAFFCKLLLFYPIYRHQKLAFIIVGISVSAIVTIEIVIGIKRIEAILLILCINFVFSLREVLHKYLIEVKAMSTVLIIFLEGILGTIICVIIALALRIDLIEEIGKAVINWESGLQFLFYYLSCVFYDFFAVITKYYYEPTVMAIAYSFSLFVVNFVNIEVRHLDHSTNEKIWFFILGSIFSLLGCIIYNEIIIIYCCDLDRNTKKEIIKRSNQECNFSELSVISEL